MSPGGKKRERDHPAYSLEELKAKFASGAYYLTGTVSKHLSREGWEESDVKACVADLHRDDFYKSQEHDHRPDTWLDIYMPVYDGRRLYVKFLIDEDQVTMILLTFCEDGAMH